VDKYGFVLNLLENAPKEHITCSVRHKIAQISHLRGKLLRKEITDIFINAYLDGNKLSPFAENIFVKVIDALDREIE
jgi:hypothetical protein